MLQKELSVAGLEVFFFLQGLGTLLQGGSLGLMQAVSLFLGSCLFFLPIHLPLCRFFEVGAEFAGFGL